MIVRAWLLLFSVLSFYAHGEVFSHKPYPDQIDAKKVNPIHFLFNHSKSAPILYDRYIFNRNSYVKNGFVAKVGYSPEKNGEYSTIEYVVYASEGASNFKLVGSHVEKNPWYMKHGKPASCYSVAGGKTFIAVESKVDYGSILVLEEVDEKLVARFEKAELVDLSKCAPITIFQYLG